MTYQYNIKAINNGFLVYLQDDYYGDAVKKYAFLDWDGVVDYVKTNPLSAEIGSESDKPEKQSAVLDV